MLRAGDTYISHAVPYMVVQEGLLFKLLSIVQKEPVTNWLSKDNMVRFLSDKDNNLTQVSRGD